MVRRMLRPHSPGGRPRLLLVDDADDTRLKMVTWLRDHFEVLVPPLNKDPAKVAVEEEPAIILLSLRDHQEITARACRRCSSLEAPPRIGVLDWEGRAEPELILSWGAQGYYGGEVLERPIQDWVERLYQGEEAIVRARQGRRARLRGFLRRLRQA